MLHLFYKWLRSLATNAFPLLAFSILAGLCSQVNGQTTFDAVADFSTNANPNGVWSYGWANEQGGTFQLLATPWTSGSGDAGWWSGLSEPDSMLIDKDYSGSALSDGSVVFDSDTLHMDPEENTAVTRFTVPSNGVYSVSGLFRLQDTGTHAHYLAILLNGSTNVFNVFTSGGIFGSEYPFSFAANLTQGETVDFTASCTNGDYYNLSTGLKATITISNSTGVSTNEPDTCTPPPSGIVGWWPGNGNAVDIFGGNNATIEGNVTFAAGEVGQAFNFNGTNGYIQLSGNYDVNGPRTLEGWVYANPNTGLGMPIFVGGTSGSGDFFGIAGTSGNCNIGQYNLYIDHWGYPCLNGQVAVTPNAWNHVAMTYDGSNIVFYVNGIAGPVINQTLYNYSLNSGTIGGNLIGGSTSQPIFSGLIDEFTIYNRALTAAEIQSVFKAGSAGKCTDALPPAIIQEPQSALGVLAGSNAMYAVAQGVQPLSYQWLFNGTNLAGTTSPFLPLNNLTLAMSGGYSLVVTNIFGAVTSTPAMLTVAFPIFLGQTVSNGVPYSGAGNIAIPGAANDYIFNAPASCVMDLTELGYSDNNMQWSLFAPNGVSVFSGNYLSWNNIGRLQLPGPGQYHLKVYDSVAAGSYSFQLSSVTDQTFAYTIGAVVSSNLPSVGEGNLTQPGEIDNYQFTAPTNLLLYVNALGWPPGGAYWSLYGPDGNVVFNSAWMPNNNIGRLQLPAQGTYRLAVSSCNGSTGAYGFQISTIQDQPTNYISLASFYPSSDFWVVNGGAVLSSNVLTLTDGNFWESRSAFYDQQQAITNFSATFVYQNVDFGSVGGLGLADGVAFVLQNSSSGSLALGEGAGELGFYGMTPSFAVELNLYNNSPGGPGFAFATNGLTAQSGGCAYASTAPVNLVSNDPIEVSLNYANGVLEISLSDLVTGDFFATNCAVDLQHVLGEGAACVGFTGGTGSGESFQQVSNFVFTNSNGVSSINFTSPPVSTPNLISANLTESGEIDSYEFTAPTNLLIYLTPVNWPSGGAYWALYGPDGSVVFNNYMPNDNIGRLQLPTQGIYRLAVSSYNGSTGAYGFQITTIQDQSFAYTVGTVVSSNLPSVGEGDLTQMGEYDTYTFVSPTNLLVYLSSLQWPLYGGSAWALYGPDGATVFSGDYMPNNYIGRLQLPSQGTYQLRVSGEKNGSAFGTYSFQVAGITDQYFTISEGQTIAPNTPSTGAGLLANPGEHDFYTFQGTGGQVISFVDNNASGSASWTVVAPDASQIFSSQFTGTGSNNITLPLTGAYTVEIQGGSSTPISYSFSILNSGTNPAYVAPATQIFPISLGQVVTNGVPALGAGNLESSNAEDIYIFNVNAGQAIYLEDLSGANPYLGVYRIYDQYGSQIAANWLNGGNNWQGNLAAGTYTIVVNNNGGTATGTYSFALLGVPAPQAFSLSLGQTVTNGVPVPGAGVIATPGASQAYTFTATNGQTVYVEDLSGNSPYVGYYRIFDPNGNQLVGNWLNGQNQWESTLSQAGTYTIVVNNAGGTATGNYSFALLGVPAPQAFSLSLGQTVTNGVPVPGAGVIATPGASQAYTFTATNGQTVYVEDLSGNSPYVGYYRIFDPNGNQLVGNWLNGQNQWESTLSQAGTYTIVVNNAGGTATGNYSFALLGVPTPQTYSLSLGQNVTNGMPAPGAGVIATPGASQAYAFTATNGQLIYLEDMSGAAPYVGYYQVIDPYGNVIAANWLNGGNNWQGTLGLAGTYSIIVNNDGGPATGTYSFALLGVPAPNIFNISLGQIVSNGVPGIGAGNLETPGASDVYNFTVNSGQAVYLQDLSGAAPNVGHYQLVDPYGNVIAANWLNGGNNWQQTLALAGTYSIIVNNNGGTGIGSYSFALLSANTTPILTALQPQFARELTLFSVSNAAYEASMNANLTYSLVSAPSGMSVSANGVITWIPGQNQSPGTNWVSLAVTSNDNQDPVNPQLSATNNFVVVVVASSNNPSGPTSISGITATNIAGTNGWLLRWFAPTNDQFVVRWTSALNPAHWNSFTNIIACSGPTTATNGLFAFFDNGSQTGGFGSTRFYQLLLVGSVAVTNRLPVLPTITNQTIKTLTTFTVTNTATESDPNAVITYTLVSPPAGMSISTDGLITWTPSRNQSSTTNLITTVATSADYLDPVNPSLSTTNIFIVIVGGSNAVPGLPTVPAYTVNELATLTVTNGATDADTHATLSYALVNAPNGASINTDGVFFWTPAQTQSPGSNIITTIATSTDASDTSNPQLSATNTFTVIVREVNVAPALPVIATKNVTAGTLLSVTNTATELNIHATVGYVLLSAPAGVAITTNGLITWTPTQAQTSGTNTITTAAISTDTLDLIHPQLSMTNSFAVIVVAGTPTNVIIPFALTNANSVVQVDPTSQRGLYAWNVSGVSQLNQKWFWISVGSNTAPVSFDALSQPLGLTPPSSNSASIIYSAPGFNAILGLNLTGGVAGSYASALAQTVTIQNTTNKSLALHLYAYSDFDLAGNPDDDAISSLSTNAVTQQGKGMTVIESVQNHAANEWEAGWYDFILEDLTEGTPILLTDDVTPSDPGDQTFAFEWDATLTAGQSLQINLTDNLQLSPVPLSIRLIGSNIAITWQTNGTASFQLYEATNLTTLTGWNMVTNVPVVVGPEFQISVPMSGKTTFFRLGL